MARDWQELTRMTRGEPFVVEKVRLAEKDITVEGNFELPPLARLATEDQIFAAAFLRCHGSIKQMEEIFGVSYPTIKNRLNRIAGQLDFVKIETAPDKSDILSRLDRGEISAEEAIEFLKRRE